MMQEHTTTVRVGDKRKLSIPRRTLRAIQLRRGTKLDVRALEDARDHGSGVQLVLGSKGRLTIPKFLAPDYISKGSRMELQIADGTVTLVPLPPRRNQPSAALRAKFALSKPSFDQAISSDQFLVRLNALDPTRLAGREVPRISLKAPQSIRKEALLAVKE